MSIRKEAAYEHILCMDLQSDGLRYAVINKSSKKIIQSTKIEFDQFDRDTLKPLLVAEELSYDYSSFVVTAAGKRNTLVPVEIFNHSKAVEIFKLNYPEPIDNLDYNRIPELGIVNVYELPVWMKSLFVIKFPRVKIVHPVTVLLKGVLNQNAWGEKVHIYIEADSFYLLITAKNKLKFFNRFDQTNTADMVYHILSVLKQKEIDQGKVETIFYGVSANWDQKQEFQEFFKNPIKIFEDTEMSDQFILAKQLLCV
jgi:Protein of unknown function (DUF3822)